MNEITAALAAARSTFDLIKVAIAARDDAKLQAAVAEMSARLTDAILSALASAEKSASLQAALSACERDKAEAHAKLLDRTQYVLQELRPGTFVYAAESDDGRAKSPQHYVCQPCYDKGIKSVLQRAQNGALLQCNTSNGHNLRVEDWGQAISHRGQAPLA